MKELTLVQVRHGNLYGIEIGFVRITVINYCCIEACKITCKYIIKIHILRFVKNQRTQASVYINCTVVLVLYCTVLTQAHMQKVKNEGSEEGRVGRQAGEASAPLGTAACPSPQPAACP